MSQQRRIRRNMAGRRGTVRNTPVDVVAHAAAQFRIDRYHARIYAHGTTITTSGLMPTNK